jgi:hypothetical protein
MSPAYRPVMLAAIHALVLSSLAAILLVERAVWPRVWVRTALDDSLSPPRGHYVSLRIEVDAGSELFGRQVALSVQTYSVPVDATIVIGEGQRHSRLVAQEATTLTGLRLLGGVRRPSVGGIYVPTPLRLDPPLTVFLPAQWSSLWPRLSDEEVWVEVTVPPRGSPRPIRAGLKKGVILTPF